MTISLKAISQVYPTRSARMLKKVEGIKIPSGLRTWTTMRLEYFAYVEVLAALTETKGAVNQTQKTLDQISAGGYRDQVRKEFEEKKDRIIARIKRLDEIDFSRKVFCATDVMHLRIALAIKYGDKHPLFKKVHAFEQATLQEDMRDKVRRENVFKPIELKVYWDSAEETRQYGPFTPDEIAMIKRALHHIIETHERKMQEDLGLIDSQIDQAENFLKEKKPVQTHLEADLRQKIEKLNPLLDIFSGDFLAYFLREHGGVDQLSEEEFLQKFQNIKAKYLLDFDLMIPEELREILSEGDRLAGAFVKISSANHYDPFVVIEQRPVYLGHRHQVLSVDLALTLGNPLGDTLLFKQERYEFPVGKQPEFVVKPNGLLVFPSLHTSPKIT